MTQQAHWQTDRQTDGRIEGPIDSERELYLNLESHQYDVLLSKRVDIKLV